MRGRSRLIHATLLTAAAVLFAGAAAAPSGGTVKVEQRDFTRHLVFTGEIVAAQSLGITAPSTRIWGQTISYLVPDGTTVKPGELVARFDTSRLELDRLDEEKKREEARVKIAQKEAELETRRRDLLLARAVAEKNLRVAELYAAIDPSLIPKSDADKYRFDLDKARLELDKANERLDNLARTRENELSVVRLELEQAELSLRKIMREIDSMTVTAPAGGLATVAEDWQSGRKLQVGDQVWEGQTVAEIPDLSTLQVRAYVHDTDALELRPGLPAEVALDALPDRAFRARLGTLAEAAKAATRDSRLKQFRLVVEFLDADPKIMKPGMTARVRVPVAHPGVLTAPRAAVRLGRKGATEVLRPGAPPRAVPVTVRDANDRLAWLEGDLRAGDELLLPAAAAATQAAAAEEWITLKPQDLAFTVSGSGAVRAARAIDIGPPPIPRTWQYKIVRMAEEGSQVQAGDFLVQFDPSEVARRLRDEQADLEKVQREVQRTEAAKASSLKDLELELEEARVARTKADNKLLESREFEASIKVREAEFEAVLAATRVEMLEGKLAAVREGARLELQLLKDKETFHGQRVRSYQEALAALEVKAPAAGVVIYQTDWNNQKRQVGSTVFVMDKVLSIPDLNTLLVRGQVAEVDAYKVRLGQAVNVTFDAIPEQVFRGRVTQMADMFTQPPGDRAVKVLELTVTLDAPDPRRMRPGMAARLAVEIDAFHGVLAVPLAVVQEEGGRSFVTVQENGRSVRRPVTVGRNNGIVAIVEKGLRAGDRVAGKPQKTVNR